MYNLISNAIKFKSNKTPVINISTALLSDSISLTVQDNGVGISKNGLDKIFEVYGRLNQDIEGHGVGLYLAKKIIHAAEGNIVVESEPGVGSKFIVYFKN